MDKLIANASVGLAKAGMNRRGFLGRVAGAVGGAAVLSVFLARTASADVYCGSTSSFCVVSEVGPYCGSEGEHPCTHGKPSITEQHGENCYTGETCWNVNYIYSGCSC